MEQQHRLPKSLRKRSSILIVQHVVSTGRVCLAMAKVVLATIPDVHVQTYLAARCMWRVDAGALFHKFRHR